MYIYRLLCFFLFGFDITSIPRAAHGYIGMNAHYVMGTHMYAMYIH